MPDYDYLVETGVILPDTADLQTLVQDEFKAVFGSDLVVTASTPQGVLITAETIARSNVLANNAALANQINPNLAGGVFLDAIWKLTGGARLAATYSSIAGVILSGVGGTLVPAGTVASVGVGGPQFASAGDVTLDLLTGLATVDFIAVESGPVAANAAALNTVVSGVLGWEGVTNPNGAVLGTDQESDGASRIRRRNTLALQSVSLPGSIIAGLYDTDGVKSLAFRENVTDATIVIDGINLVEHSIYLCVDGGTDLAVATAILARKSMGANYNGTTTVNVTEPSSGQVYPVKFSRPTLVPVFARATIKVAGSTGDPTTLVEAAVLAYANGEMEGEPGFTVNGSVSPFELAGAVNVQTPGIYVQKMEVSLDGVTWVVAELPITISQKATINEASVIVVIA